MSLLVKIFGDLNKKELKKSQPLIEEINSLEPKLEKLNAQELKQKTQELRGFLKQGQTKDDILPLAFALVREAAKRTLNQRHYDVQLIGGIVLHQGKIAEMRTGEGKTLASTAPAYLNALDKKGVHIITVNDYLSKRDCVWMGQIYHYLGLRVSCIVHETAFIYDPDFSAAAEKLDQERDQKGSFKVVEDFLRPISRKQAYQADITYGTNNEFGFDFLRDNLIYDPQQIVQRELSYAIIDEVDSILIDEARTPLIISSPAEESADLYYQLATLVTKLKSEKDYVVDEKMRAVTLTEEGINQMVNFLGQDPWQKNNFNLIHHIDAALKAKTLFQRDRDYVIKEGEIIIIDEFTGRLMEGRRYSEGLHQAIEAKERVKVRQESKTLATITFQNYFRYYQKLAGMTGTALTEAEEFDKIYDLEVMVIPTHRPMIRKDLPDRIYQNKEGKWQAMVKEIKERHQQGQPILIGTGGFTIGEKTIGAIEKNKLIKDLLARQGIECQVLDATNHEKEGQIIAQAGRLGAVTVATNMAGRGVDIVLGGNPPDKKEQQKILDLGGLHIIGTERHEARRIDNQLRGRAGRQGDPGSSQFFISLEDDLMRVFGGSRLSGVMQTLKVPPEVPIESKMVSRAIESAQKKVEGFNFDTRKHLLEYDDVLNKHRETIYQKRKQYLVMSDQDLKQEVLKMIEQEIEQIVDLHTQGEPQQWNQEKISQIIKSIFLVKEDLEESLKGKKPLEIKSYLKELANQSWQELEQQVEAQKEKLGEDQEKSLIAKIARSILLTSIDRAWVSHLEIIQNLKGGIGLRAYGQQDPLAEYKKESRIKFKQLMEAVRRQVVFSIYKVGFLEKSPLSNKEIKLQGAPKTTVSQPASARPQGQKKIGRNDPCPCGSGKKYKKCCYPKFD